MCSTLKTLAAAVFAVALFSVPSFAQVTGVEGDVKAADGSPLVGAVVHFERTDIKGNYTVKTNKKGHYGHYGLPLGTYTVTLEVEGKVVDSVKGFRTRLGDPTQLPFNMKAQAKAQQEVQKAAETGTLTKEQERGMTKEQKEKFEKEAKAREAALSKNKELNDAFTAGKAAMDAALSDAAQAVKESDLSKKDELRKKVVADYESAIAQFKKASELDPAQNVVWAQLADAYIQLAKTKTGEEQETIRKDGFNAYEKAIELKPDEAAYHNNYALALAGAKKIDEAKAHLSKAIELDPPNAGRYFYNMGAVLVIGNQNDLAGEEFKNAISRDPSYADAQFQYGVFLAGKATADPTGKIIVTPGTIEALQKYLELNPDGQYAGQAKDLITQLGGTLSTTYSNPNAPKKTVTPTKKKN